MKGFYRMKKWLMPLTGFVAMVAFLVMCSEPAPGDDMSEWGFLWPKLLAMVVMAGCVWTVRKLDKTD